MRVKKSELAGMVRQLSDINDQIEKKGMIPDDVKLSKCQELAVKLGEFIEENYKETNTKAVIHQLEDYCELIYQMSLAENQNTEMLVKLTKKVQIILADCESAINVDLPKDRKQIVFLPYKASMWDSLESIWMAARDDPDVDAYVIPIPYCDRNPDGSVRQWHYEGDQYPDYVPVIDWQKYSIPDEKPDVIFIHNPYDGNNYVTSVHPSFYSSELKKYTDCLVYVPYFILGETDPDNQETVDGIKHFIIVPGVIYADKVIVQSEDMKKIYVNEYLKFAKESGLSGRHQDRAYQENRILGLGSPKYDKVIASASEEIDVPEEWKKIIFRSDGSRKKVILYNNGISALLQENEKILEKMLRVFDIFEKNKEDVALLWRPHPLIQTTLTSMRPQLWEAYKKIVDTYKTEAWGIYDDTAELERAIVLSDGYYGDGSSIVELYKATLKPVMLANAEV